MRYDIFHYEGDRYRAFSEDAFKDWATRAGYVKIGTVEAAHVEHAFELTNSVYGPWWENEGTTLEPGLKGARSLSVGDVLVDDDGLAWGVAGAGFTEVTAWPEV